MSEPRRFRRRLAGERVVWRNAHGLSLVASRVGVYGRVWRAYEWSEVLDAWRFVGIYSRRADAVADVF